MNPQPSLPTPPSHTHTHTPTQFCWTPGPSPKILKPHWAPCAFIGPVRVTSTIPLVSLCVHRDVHIIPLGSLCVCRDVPSHKPPKCPVQPFFSILCSIFLYCISYKRQHGSACVLARCGVQSSGIFVILWPTCVVLSRFVSSPVARGEHPTKH